MFYRILTAAVGIPVLFAFVYFGFPWISILVGVIAILAALEFSGLARARGLQPFMPLLALWSVTFIITGHFIADGELTRTAIVYVFISGLGLSAVWALLNRGGQDMLLSWSYMTGGAIYTGWFLSYVLLIRGLDQGVEWVVLLLGATFATDTAAFFVGRLIGRHKMTPVMSPGKTWEGAAGGLLAAIAATPLLVLLLGVDIAVWQSLILGALIGVFAQLGDLIESMLKRLSKVKDSGNLLPGHGGILDRLDSVVLNIVIVYYFAIWST